MDQFFYCLVLLCQNFSFEAMIVFYYEHRSILSFVIFKKRLTLNFKNFYFLLLDIRKKMNPGSSGLYFVQIDLQKLKSIN